MFLLQQDIFLWDLAILLIMAITFCGGLGCVIGLRRCHRSRLGFLGFFCFFGFLIVTYAAFIEPQIIVVNHATVSHPLAEPMKVAVISDTHIGPYKGEKFLQRVVTKLNSLLPDMVLMPGDFVFTRSADVSDLSPLEDIRAPLGTFAVLGNHDVGEYQSLLGTRYRGDDRGEKIALALEEFGVQVLRNTNVTVQLPNAKIAVAGIDDVWTGHFDLTESMRSIPSQRYTILLSHNPSVIDENETDAAHLIVSGHTHGGQLRLPLMGPLTTLPTSLGNAYDQGLFGLDDGRTLAISRGVGESSARARLFAWPEILLITIEPLQ